MSTKIVVFKLSEVLKTSLLAILGLIILIAITLFFIPKDENESVYNAGVYSSEIILHSNPVLVEVTVSTDEILSINMLNMQETQEVFYPLFERSIEDVSAQIIQNQSTDFQLVSDAPYTDNILVEAVAMALKEAKK